MKVLFIDNYDSFSFNLVQAFRMLDAQVLVKRNDELEPEQAKTLDATHLVVSPGPGAPEGAGNSMSLIEAFLGRIPILGVCLGHQALARVCGAEVVRAPLPVHGKASRVYHDGRTLYRGLKNPFEAGRYHSLCVEERSLPKTLAISAYSADGEILGVRHRDFAAEGVQFHPESVLTPDGARLLANFLALRETAGTPSPRLRRDDPEEVLR